MRSSLTNDNLVLYFEGRIDSGNAPQVEAEVMAVLDEAQYATVTIDAENLEYISSAGLRVVLKIGKRNAGLKIVNASAEVFDIFEMTGFTEMFPVERALRKFSVEGCPVVGQGAVGTLYQYDRDTVIKVYREGSSIESLQEERERSQLALVMGVPTCISFDVVRVGNCYATVYEMINSSSMGGLIGKNPACAGEMGVQFGEVLRQIHAIDASSLKIPQEKDVYRKAAKNLAPNYTAGEYETICSWINAMPGGNAFVHGDFHPKNIMLQDNEPLLIDMGDISIGHPLYDVATAYFVIFWLTPEVAEQCSGVPRSVARTFWDAFMKTYFATEDAAKLAQLEETIACAAQVRATVVYGISNTFPQEVVDARVKIVRETILPKSDEILRKLADAQNLFAEFSLL